ncbi:hypothetical protein ACHAXA_001401 [Cyclostephanos tholiformis]|uniref:Uncharacterized protein n=1 Tax=Cyclostephanos tholiformis TaxID=382380 RepID=A0ABD3RF38_9STRA
MASINNQADQEDFLVILAASACVVLQDHQTRETAPHVIHAVSVTQPAQSWTVLRDHIDFLNMNVALGEALLGLPPCASAPADVAPGSPREVDGIVMARNSAQEWLSSVLSVPAVRESPIMKQFLCYGANVVPPQFEGLAWVDFTAPNLEQQPTGPGQAPTPNTNAAAKPGGGSSFSRPNLDEMEMDDMFLLDDEPQNKREDEDDNSVYSEDDADYLQGRYVPTVEQITESEIMEIQQDYKQVEMVEDVGSLAQSMGASHLGRSLNLQKEVGFRQAQQMQQHQKNMQGGIYISVQANNTIPESNQSISSFAGGIGGAMAKAEQYSSLQATQAHVKELGDSFHRTAPISPPRLDSFQMMKVIGKGSFAYLHR